MRPAFYLIAILLVSTFVFQAGNVFATHLTDKTTWQLIYVTHNHACSNYDHQIFNKYAELTEKYFALYQFDNTKIDSSCMPIDFFRDHYERPVEVDLLVVVYDRELGESELHSKNFGGAYLHEGTDRRQNHVIMMCDCANFYFSDPVWILSHELSHFILYVLNFDTLIIEDLVHTYDEEYDSCMTEYSPQCTDVIYKLRVDSAAYSFSVMPPYKNAIGIEKLETPTKIPTNVISLNKIITKWWMEGKITSDEYGRAVGHMVSEQEYHDIINTKTVLGDEPIKGDEKTWRDIFAPKQESVDLFSILPFALDTQDRKAEHPTVLPDWFENSAKLWAGGAMTNEDFIRNVKYLKELKTTQDTPDSNLEEVIVDDLYESDDYPSLEEIIADNASKSTDSAQTE
jgi:hypothetical protein